jgi:hypothetical protein
MQTTVFKDVIHKIMEIYIDDIIIWGRDAEDLTKNMEKVFKLMREFNLTVNPEKCTFGHDTVEYVGHVISTAGDKPSIKFSQHKLDNVGAFELPENHRKMKSFLGLVSYFREHIPNHTEIVAPLQEMITGYKPRQRLQWSQIQERCFETAKEAVVNCKKLYFFKDDLPIYVQTDASDYGVGAYLFQVEDDTLTGRKKEIPIGFISKSLDKVQRR